MQRELYILGGSGHALVVNELALLTGWTVKGYFDRQESDLFSKSLLFMGAESEASIRGCSQKAVFFPAIGDSDVREKIIRFVERNQLEQTVLIHPSAIISSQSRIGLSSMVGAGAIVNPQAQIGSGVIINSGAIVEHECVVEDFCHIAPGATLLGKVQVGTGSFIGANAVVKQGVRIGKQVTIGAGSVVLKDVPDNGIMAGNPARFLK